MDILKSSLVAFIMTLFCIWLLKPLAHRVGFVDRPGGRKLHSDNVPLIGGIAMFFGFCFAVLTLHISLQSYRGLLAGCAILILMGVVDDFRELSSKLRLIGQLLATLFLIAWGDHVVTNLGNIFFLGEVHLGRWSVPLTVIAVVGFINAINMIDGQDGLAGGVALGQVLLFLFLSIHLQRFADMRLLIIMSVLLIVFLSFNMRLVGHKKAVIFMGDSGSTFIAFLIAWFAIDISQTNIAQIKPVTILWILAFPLFDLISVSAYRIKRGLSPLTAGRDHFHHVLHLKGINLGVSTILLCMLSLSFGVIGIALNFYGVAEGWQFVGLMSALVCYLLLVKIVR